MLMIVLGNVRHSEYFSSAAESSVSRYTYICDFVFQNDDSVVFVLCRQLFFVFT